jgi:hypothetical protein
VAKQDLHVTHSQDSIEEDSVVRTLFKDFVAALEKDESLDQAIIANLRNALVTQGDLSVEALKRALFPESSIP